MLVDSRVEFIQILIKKKTARIPHWNTFSFAFTGKTDCLNNVRQSERKHVRLNSYICSRFALTSVPFVCSNMAAWKPRFVCHGYRVCISASPERPSTSGISGQLAALSVFTETSGTFGHANIAEFWMMRVCDGLYLNRNDTGRFGASRRCLTWVELEQCVSFITAQGGGLNRLYVHSLGVDGLLYTLPTKGN